MRIQAFADVKMWLLGKLWKMRDLRGKEQFVKSLSSEENGEMAIYIVFSEKNGKNQKYWQEQLHETKIALSLPHNNFEQSL